MTQPKNENRKPVAWFPVLELERRSPDRQVSKCNRSVPVRSSAFRHLLALLQRAQAGINRVLAELLFDAQQLIVFRQPVGTAQGTGFNLSAVRRDGNVRNRRVFRFAGAMRENGGVAVELRELHSVERFSERTDLVHLHE